MYLSATLHHSEKHAHNMASLQRGVSSAQLHHRLMLRQAISAAVTSGYADLGPSRDFKPTDPSSFLPSLSDQKSSFAPDLGLMKLTDHTPSPATATATPCGSSSFLDNSPYSERSLRFPGHDQQLQHHQNQQLEV